jgi:hypothetical protein
MTHYFYPIFFINKHLLHLSDANTTTSFTRLEWTNTHQCTNMDGWCIHGCTFFVTPYPWANQDGKLKFAFFFSLYLTHVGFFGEFFSSPPTPA